MAKHEDKEEKKDNLFDAKAARKKAWEEKQSIKSVEEDSREEFRKFFIKIKGKLGLFKDMEEVIWLHFKSIGFTKKEKFEEGIKHFGYRL